jgi:hypothetical protein
MISVETFMSLWLTIREKKPADFPKGKNANPMLSPGAGTI